MSVKIRLKRIGKKRQASFRVVVSDSSNAPTGSFLEELGTYDPRQQPSQVEIDEDKALEWLENGAKPSNTVRSLLKDTGVWAEFIGEEN
ncbi:30S ribosomal protein S16 [Halarsenatibacter silvermanii]|uniref:Small ribosomal subunit protein bS16 n=1 Tax=Halarsenatibacter silvermanii TaxID=321763 RepID=A0A1G9PI83_9FIRM|nr:30S ribosomal protein S16 [Halarsenatibacter silvermanii]SDL98253.1 small subunit ribosomal protein S16 [Halarsenatibacter silvermanii]